MEKLADESGRLAAARWQQDPHARLEKTYRLGGRHRRLRPRMGVDGRTRVSRRGPAGSSRVGRARPMAAKWRAMTPGSAATMWPSCSSQPLPTISGAPVPQTPSILARATRPDRVQHPTVLDTSDLILALFHSDLLELI